MPLGCRLGAGLAGYGGADDWFCWVVGGWQAAVGAESWEGTESRMGRQSGWALMGEMRCGGARVAVHPTSTDYSIHDSLRALVSGYLCESW